MLSSSLSEDYSEARIKIIDFGFATEAYGASLIESVGSLYYAAPEIYNHEQYGKPVDMWAVGVIAYALLSYHLPFHSFDRAATKAKVTRAVVTFKNMVEEMDDDGNLTEVNVWDKISQNAKDFISQLLRRDPLQRMTVDKALAHPWMRMDVGSIMTVITAKKVCKRWRKFTHSRKLKRESEEKLRNNHCDENSEEGEGEGEGYSGMLVKSPQIPSGLTKDDDVSPDATLLQLKTFLSEEDKYSIMQRSSKTDHNGVPSLTYVATHTETKEIVQIIVYQFSKLNSSQQAQVRKDIKVVDEMPLRSKLPFYFTKETEDELYVFNRINEEVVQSCARSCSSTSEQNIVKLLEEEDGEEGKEREDGTHDVDNCVQAQSPNRAEKYSMTDTIFSWFSSFRLPRLRAEN